MQPINAAPRTALDPAQVASLIQGAPAITVTAGAQLVEPVTNMAVGGACSAFISADGQLGAVATRWGGEGTYSIETDSGFSDDTTYARKTWTTTTAPSHSGIQATGVNAEVVTPGGAGQPVQPNTTYTLTCRVRSVKALYDPASSYTIKIREVADSSTWSTNIAISTRVPAKNGEWADVTHTFTTTSTTTGIAVIVTSWGDSQNISPGDTFDVTAIMLTQGDRSYPTFFTGTNPVTPTTDLSPWLRADTAPTVESDSTATIHRSCSLTLDGDVPFNYLKDFVQLYSTVTNNDTGFAARFNMGVYTLSSPQIDHSSVPVTLDFDGYDLLAILDMPYGDTFYVAPGASIDTAIATVLHGALPNATIIGSTGLTAGGTGLTWPFDDSDTYTYLDIINGMLTAGGFLPLWADWNGAFHITPAADFSTWPIEYTFDLTDDDCIVSEARQLTNDLSDVPNKWQFVMSGLETAPVEGSTQYTYTDTRANSATSTVNRGRTVFKPVFLDTPTQDSTSYANLVQQGQNIVQADLHTSEQFAVSTSPFPIAWHYDSIQYNDPNLANVAPMNSTTRHTIATSWEYTLDGTNDSTFTLSTVQPL